ncbi:YciI family protein [Microbaculum marinum]|uniref:YciI family protein n=1 Tax=Microbaculum marinum TaxID=1764581 RepID=A0AAW9RUL7_9HYPH
MPFHITCLDDPAKPGLRQKTRAEHLRYMIAHKDHILFGGPMRVEPDGPVVGSAFALDYETRAEVDAFLAGEPYYLAGLFESVVVRAIAVMVPERAPGFLEQELERELGK